MIRNTIKPIDWNWKPTRSVCFVDFETQSVIDLKKSGVWVYINHPSTRLMSAVFKVKGKKPVTWVPRPLPGLKFPGMVTGEAIPDEVKDLAKSCTWVAHNAEGFDALIWSKLYPSIRPEWQDTQILARCVGLPGSLDKLSKRLGGPGKDSIGSRAMKLLCEAKFRNGRVTYPKGTVPLWSKMLKYNVEDVNELERIYTHVSPALKFHAPALTIHSKINDRGIRVDVPLAKKLLTFWDRVKHDAHDEIAELTKGELTTENVKSGPATHKWLQKQGLHLDNLRREEVQMVLDDPDQLEGVEDLELVREVLTQRSLVLRPAENKLQRLIEAGGDTLRYLLTYHAAQTGRFGSRLVQVHNLPSRAKADVEALLKNLTLESLGDDPATTLNALVRPVFRATPGKKLGIIDFASIEARGIAWIADQDDLLEVFTNHGDVYLDMATSLFGRDVTVDDVKERQVGKLVILGCGYGMGSVKFEATCRKERVDLKAVDLDGKTCVNAYRRRYSMIPKVWKSLELAALTALRTKKTQEAGRCRFSFDGEALVITLPSGRPVYYRNARVEQVVPAWAKLTDRKVSVQDAILYEHPHGYPKTLYGGLIAENVVQAICRDIMVESLSRLDAAGYDTRVHVHDEIVYEGTGSREELQQACELMTIVPKWAEGFPISVEGFTNDRYTKKPFSDSRRAKA